MIAGKVPVRAMCASCGGYRDVDLEVIAKAKGEDYDLSNRTTCCRITEGCEGRVRFHFFGRGRYETKGGATAAWLRPERTFPQSFRPKAF